MSTCQSHSVKRRLFKDAGRACPIDYKIAEDAFSGTPQESCDVLYVVGGLYGNPFALDAIEAMIQAEDSSKKTLVVFNGDAHWFDKTAENFAAIEDRIQKYVPLVGNVEAELRRQTDVGVGCGCAYPECTTDEAVSRSNRIHKMLSIAVDKHPELKQRLVGRPATLTVDVAGFKVGITHGDEKLIGGWDCSRETLQDIMRQDELDGFMAANGIDVFVTTHTCAPVALTLARGAIINNGAAGLPNFAGENFGLCIRIACNSSEEWSFGTQLDDLFIQAVPVRYDHNAYVKWFDALWSETSPAAVSYRDRILNGPEDYLIDSLLGGFSCGPSAAGVRRSGTRATVRDVNLELAKLLYFEDVLDDESCTITDPFPNTLQVNLTAKCNMACAHCHHGCNPKRDEHMNHETLEAILKVARDRQMQTIDITGGAPEMHPEFEWFLREAANAVPNVMVRTNLTVLDLPEYSHLLDVYARLGIELVASLPNVFGAQADMQRGHKTYDKSIKILKLLNDLGYGRDSSCVLDLVFNPQEPIMPPEQNELEQMYRRRLGQVGIDFNNLFAVANNPIGKYGASLIDSGAFQNYMDLLIDSFNPDTCENMMCRHQLSVGWDGTVYDCDFNLALGLAAEDENGPINIADYANDAARSLQRSIKFGNHCYACTAGFGSSCGGTLVQGEAN
ncbi:arsenosugar biosynthesis radical SAM (seleno)protein ArsS [Adlercreutzia sp. ZJ154]|uniref:arsenosugar biosynthesis radical SAM (seleno)protein ArsS n=1 Tax=Adlercreutzia sp. ZJ154 TaxID=2709790 RepID=UPI0013ED5EAD|nr:arsenosugar biosynthesis radical SAM (seleno)protein ArsS [Adlercreutzia sp. ZJ154]